jgi:predicted helicase
MSDRPNGSIELAGIFASHCQGLASGRDDFIYDFDRDRLVKRVRDSTEGVDFDESTIRPALFRPFTRKWVYVDPSRKKAASIWRAGAGNVAIVLGGGGGGGGGGVMVSDAVTDARFFGRRERVTCLPFYHFDEDGGNRRENITDSAIDAFGRHYNDRAISKWSIFDYVYGMLHHPDVPKESATIPFAPDFRAFQRAGQALIHLHLHFDELEPWPLARLEPPEAVVDHRVERMKLSRDKRTIRVNQTLTLGELPKEAIEFRVARRSPIEWLIDQYQFRPGSEDPNRDDDPTFVVRHFGQVVRTSVETMKIIQSLPADSEAAIEYDPPRAGAV